MRIQPGKGQAYQQCFSQAVGCIDLTGIKAALPFEGGNEIHESIKKQESGTGIADGGQPETGLGQNHAKTGNTYANKRCVRNGANQAYPENMFSLKALAKNKRVLRTNG